MSRTRFPWRWLLFLIVTVLGSVIAYDIYSSQGFKHSKSHNILADAGILAFLEQAWKRFAVFSNKALSWLQENVPFYYSKVCEFVGPYIHLFWEKLYDFGVYLVEVSKPVRAWLNEKIPQLIEWIQTNFPWDTVCYYWGIVWTFIVTYSCWLWDHLVCFTNCSTTWLLENIFTGSLSPENILSTLSSMMAVVQSYILAAVHWLSALLFNPASDNTAAGKEL